MLIISINSAGEEGKKAIFLSLVAVLLGLSSRLGIVSQSVSNSLAVIFGSPLTVKKLEVMRQVSLALSNSKPSSLNEYTAGEPREGTDSSLTVPWEDVKEMAGNTSMKLRRK